MRGITELASKVIVVVVVVSMARAAMGEILVDRWYEMGDLPRETAAPGNVVGSGLSGNEAGVTLNTIDSPSTENPIQAPAPGDDLLGQGDPVYVDVSDRPFAAAGSLGVAFDGENDVLRAANWYPRDSLTYNEYGRTFHIGFQFDVKPSGTKKDARQDVVLNGGFGIFIGDNNHWWASYTTFEYDMGVPVNYDRWAHWTYWTDGFYVNTYKDGEFVWNHADFYGGAGGQYVTVGANWSGETNFFEGQVDEVKMFTDDLGEIVVPTPFDLSQADDFLIARMRGVSDADVNLDGVLNQDDIDTFLANEGRTFLGDAVVRESDPTKILIGSLTSRAVGDINFDTHLD